MKSIILTLGLAALANAQKAPAKPPAGATAGTCGAVATQEDWCEGAGFDPKKLETECIGMPDGKGATDKKCLKTECCNAVTECSFTHWHMKPGEDGAAPTVEETEGSPKQACMYYQECYESKNKTMSGCKIKGNQVCERYQFLGTEGDVVATHGVDAVYGVSAVTKALGPALNKGSCHPTTTCCGDFCCKETETCMAMPGGKVPTPKGVMDLNSFEYDFTTQHLWKIQQNGGMMADGTAPKNYPMWCAPGILGPNKATKAVVTPLLAMLLLMTVAVAGFRRSNTGFFDKVAPLCVFLTGFFLMLSEGSTFSLLTAVVASTTMACPDNKKGYLVVGQLFFLWLLFGGNQFFFQTTMGKDKNTLVNYFVLAQSTKMVELGTRCTDFYAGYFMYAGPAKAWGIAPNRVSYGLCSREFIGFEVFMAYLNAFAVFTMVAHTVHVYLAPVAGVATNDQVKAPVEMATVTVTNGV